jgi:hypothetical protein
MKGKGLNAAMNQGEKASTASLSASGWFALPGLGGWQVPSSSGGAVGNG